MQRHVLNRFDYTENNLIKWRTATTASQPASKSLPRPRTANRYSFFDNDRYQYCILILKSIQSISRYLHNNIAQRDHSRLKGRDLRSGAPHTTYYYCLRSNHAQWLQQWRPPCSFLGSVHMQIFLILLEYICILQLVGRYFAILLLLFSRILAVDID